MCIRDRIKLAQRGVINPIVSKHYKLDDANTALDDLKNRKIIGRAVINHNSLF